MYPLCTDKYLIEWHFMVRYAHLRFYMSRKEWYELVKSKTEEVYERRIKQNQSNLSRQENRD